MAGRSPQRGEMLTAISTGMVKLFRRHYGRGPMKAKTYAHDDVIVCILREAGLTTFEQTLSERGNDARILGLRRSLQTIIVPEVRSIVEEATGLTVRTVLSDTSIDPDVTSYTFVLDSGVTPPGPAEAD